MASKLQIVGGVNLWTYLRDHPHETKITVAYQLEIGRALNSAEQEHLKRYFMGLITEEELLMELPGTDECWLDLVI